MFAKGNYSNTWRDITGRTHMKSTNVTHHNFHVSNMTLQVTSPFTQTEDRSVSTLYTPKRSPDTRTHPANLQSLQRSNNLNLGHRERAWMENYRAHIKNSY